MSMGGCAAEPLLVSFSWHDNTRRGVVCSTFERSIACNMNKSNLTAGEEGTKDGIIMTHWYVIERKKERKTLNMTLSCWQHYIYHVCTFLCHVRGVDHKHKCVCISAQLSHCSCQLCVSIVSPFSPRAIVHWRHKFVHSCTLAGLSCQSLSSTLYTWAYTETLGI